MAWLLYLYTPQGLHLCGMKEQAVERAKSEKKKSRLAIKLVTRFLPDSGKEFMCEK